MRIILYILYYKAANAVDTSPAKNQLVFYEKIEKA